MSGEDAFNDLGWVCECAFCGRKLDLPHQSRNLAMNAALAMGWRKLDLPLPFGWEEARVPNEKCPECVEAGK